MTKPDRQITWKMDGQEFSLRFSGDTVQVFQGDLPAENPFKSPYKVEDLQQLQACLSPINTLCVVHPNYPPYLLRRDREYWFFEPMRFDKVSG